jgi:hypothetical protein
MIPTEDNYVDWFICSARAYFLRKGYAFFSFSVGQVKESDFPADKLLIVGNKLVGLQFKRPIEAPAKRSGLEYKMDEAQHKRMRNAEPGWLYYALPQTTDPLDQRLMHQKMAFVEAGEVEMTTSETFVPRNALSFRQLVRGVEACPIGQKLPVGYTVKEFLAAIQRDPATMYLFVNTSDKVVFAVRSAIGELR